MTNKQILGLLFLLIGSLSDLQAIDLRYRPRSNQPWAPKQDDGVQEFQMSLTQQRRSEEFDDNDELSSIKDSLVEAQAVFKTDHQKVQQKAPQSPQSIVQAPQSVVQVKQTQTTIKKAAKQAEDNQLTLVQAQYRSSLISNVEYSVSLSLPKGALYFGKAAIHFELMRVPAPSEQPIFIDFFGTDVANLVINDKPVVTADVGSYFRDGTIILDRNLLKVGMNSVTVEMINKYRNDGYGLHSFTDRVDMNQYIYTQFEPNYCHYVFPSFDQPDMRAKLSLSTYAPKEWSVISNEAPFQTLAQDYQSQVLASLSSVARTFNQSELMNSQIQAQDQVTVFQQTFKISPYLFAIVAGPYSYVESQTVEEGLPPLRVYLRSSVIKSIEPQILDEMLYSTLVGMRFYKDLFGIPYQFRKYDQIFVPEFNAGAMENVACVTFNEGELRRGQTMTLDEQMTLTNTILHELAHQWFGNLVTMKWWNDLWLNESFATFMSYLVMTQAPELHKYREAWIDFMGRKFEGINADILKTTHPVVNNIQSVAEAESVFNGISYGKGASFLKQANKVLGQDNLKKALHQYFQKYQWTNTEFSDFIGTLQEAYTAKNDTSMGASFDFKEWCDQWLKTSGVNTLEPHVELNANNSLVNLRIDQFIDPHGENRLRTSKIDIGIYDKDYQPHIIKDFVLSNTNQTNILTHDYLSQLNGFNGPVKAVILNEGDHVYSKVRFDNNTLQSFKKDGLKIQDALTRSLIWRNMWQQVLDLKLSASDFFNFLLQNLPNETTEDSVKDQIKNARGLINFFLPTDKVQKSKEMFFDALLGIASKPTTSNNIKEKIIEDLDQFLSTEWHSQLFVQWLERGQAFIQDAQQTPIMNLTQSQKRSMLKGICGMSSITQEAKFSLLQQTLGDDKSDESVETHIYCLAAFPDPESKKAAWIKIHDKEGNKMSQKEIEEVITGFSHTDQPQVIAKYNDMFFASLHDMFKTSSYKLFKAYLHVLMPRKGEISDDMIKKLQAHLSQSPEAHAGTPSTSSPQAASAAHSVVAAEPTPAVDESDKAFQKLIQESIELIERQKKIRELATKETL